MNERQKELYSFLLNNAVEHFASKEYICLALPTLYAREKEVCNEHSSAAYHLIRHDIRKINHDETIDNIIISSPEGYKIASNEQEAVEYVNKMYHQAIDKLARVSKMQRKIGRNNQLRAKGESIEVVKTFEVNDENY